ncbi:hypothetical protein [Zoogloea sp.]|uniref:hypothetical protein n=1 Tax=Zoogloea sp. TaxID=49181 RepID=UPI00262FCEC6|nr:hypothetical protein [uncultured Zoogloea sp.]
MSFFDAFLLFAKWSNDNQGVVTIAVFLATLGLGWISGIFSALRRKPKFRISVISGPTFCCTYFTGAKHEAFDVHRTGIALYLKISNVGTAPSSIEDISVGYHWNLKPFSIFWLRYSIGWFWLHQQIAALADFQAMIGENIKVYPFLMQRGILFSSKAETYLDVGRSSNGVVYFEQDDSWGGCFPSVRDERVRLRVRIKDIFGRSHYATFHVPSVSLEEARKYNPSFGKTLSELRGQELPFDTAANPPFNTEASPIGGAPPS